MLKYNMFQKFRALNEVDVPDMLCPGSLCVRPIHHTGPTENLRGTHSGTRLSCSFLSAGATNVNEICHTDRREKGFPLPFVANTSWDSGFFCWQARGRKQHSDYGRGGVDDTLRRAAGAAKIVEWNFQDFAKER